MGRKIRVKIDENRQIFIHNDLANAAFHFKERVEQKHKADDLYTIGLDMMGCIMTLSFTNEARMNFLGYKLIEGWNEWQTIKDKVKKVARKLGTPANFGARPYSTIMEVKEFRDIFAHGKPIVVNSTHELVTTQDEIDRYNILQPEWQRFLTVEFVQKAYADLEEIWDALLKLAGLSVFETMTHGGRSIQFIDYADGEEDDASPPTKAI
ncbi:hypothetical protein [Rhizobium leguminosarum]|uniref:hypothetical protein n=1 Tax=Rhizobium leguminosarum TaxID=384 RepID=UPI00103084F6|nr:hypothetical protein [Rhizobium leguminosarum]TAY69306.1 hypothetical protein ELH82_25470 [Rhizobium leguminosarum]